MSPHFKAERDGNPVEIPESYLEGKKEWNYLGELKELKGVKEVKGR